MTIKQQLRELTSIKNLELEKITLKEQKEIFENDLLNDINYLIDTFIINTKYFNNLNNKGLLSYYYNNKFEIIDNLTSDLLKIKIEKDTEKNFFDDTGHLVGFKNEAQKVPKYGALNENKLKIIIEDLILEKLEKDTKQETKEKKILKENKSELIFEYMLKNKDDNAFLSYETFKSEFFKIDLKDFLGLDLENIDDLEAYKSALRKYKRLFNEEIKEHIQEQDQEPKKRAQIAGLSPLSAGLGVFIGICQAFSKDKR